MTMKMDREITIKRRKHPSAPRYPGRANQELGSAITKLLSLLDMVEREQFAERCLVLDEEGTSTDFDAVLPGDTVGVALEFEDGYLSTQLKVDKVLDDVIYGKDYPIDLPCPSCNATNKIDIDLTQLPESNIPDDVVSPSPGVFEFVLPQSKRVIHFQLLTIGADKRITKDLEAVKKINRSSQVIDRELTTRLKNIIVSVDGESDKATINNFVDNELFAMDSRALRTYMREISPDVKFQIDNFVCTECDHEEEALGFSIDTNFFWPKS